MRVLTQSLPDGLRGIIYYKQIVISGAYTPVSFSIPVGQLIDGLKLDPATGLITGTPKIAAASGFLLKVTDSRGREAYQNLGIVVKENGAFPFQ
jgi:hypothetical protein